MSICGESQRVSESLRESIEKHHVTSMMTVIEDINIRPLGFSAACGNATARTEWRGLMKT